MQTEIGRSRFVEFAIVALVSAAVGIGVGYCLALDWACPLPYFP